MNRILTTLTALSLGALLMSSAPAQEHRTASKVPGASSAGKITGGFELTCAQAAAQHDAEERDMVALGFAAGRTW